MKRLEELKNDFSKALDRLSEAVNTANTELEIDGCIQRFEFCFELCWKTLKVYLEYQGIIANSPRNCIKEAYKMDVINNEELWLNILADRNATSHIYDEKISRNIFERIKNYVVEFSKVLERMNET